MILDFENILTRQPGGALGQTLAAAAANTPVPTTKAIFIGTAGVTPRGNELPSNFGEAAGGFYCHVKTALSAGGAGGKLRVQLVQADNEALTSNVDVLTQTDDVPVETAIAGYRFLVTKPRQGFTKAWIGMRFLPTVQTVSGVLEAGFAMNQPTV